MERDQLFLMFARPFYRLVCRLGYCDLEGGSTGAASMLE
jgi:hypothetical protein